MIQTRICLAFILCTLISSCAALYSARGDVQLLTAKDFDKRINASEQVTMVEFFAPWCGHCKNLAPTYNKLATTMKGMLNVAAIDCDEDSNKSICGQYGIQGFPTIKVMTPKKNKKGGIVLSASDYNGQRTVKAMAEHLTSIMSSTVKKLSSESLPDFLQTRNETAKVLLFTKKGTVSSIFKALSTSFKDSLSFGQVRDNQKEAIELFGITAFPTLVVLPGSDMPSVTYDGDMQLESIKSFLTKVLEDGTPNRTTEAPLGGKKPEDEKTDPPTTSSSPGYIVLDTYDEFRKNCLQSGSKSSLLVPVPLLSDLTSTKKEDDMPYLGMSANLGAALQDKFGMPANQALFINSKRSWYIATDTLPQSMSAIGEFVDSVRRGEAGRKVKFHEKEEL